MSSNGLHTNGYSLVRLLMDMHPDLPGVNVDGETFISTIMRPHTAYYPILKDVLNNEWISGMAHITGGGIKGNLGRIIPENLCAEIDLSLIKILPVFKLIRDIGKVQDEEMLSTFNCGVGLILIVKDEVANRIKAHINKYIPCYEIGMIKNRTNVEKVEYMNKLKWDE